MSDALIKTLQKRSGGLFRSIAIFIATLVTVNTAMAEDFMVQYDQSRLIRLARPANDIIVGNSSIADVTIQGKQLLVITGKSFGVTNLIVLDAKGTVIMNRKLIVQGDVRKFVNLQLGNQRQRYNCSPTCQSALIVGDQVAYFNDLLAKAIEKKNSISSEEGGNSGR